MNGYSEAANNNHYYSYSLASIATLITFALMTDSKPSIRFEALGEAIEASLKRQGVAKKDLAAKAGISPATISMLIGGDGHRLALHTVMRVCKEAGVNLAEFEPETSALSFCPNLECPLGMPLKLGKIWHFQPFFFPVKFTCCPQCGTQLQRGCPNCQNPLNIEGLFCTSCGKPLVKNEDENGDSIIYRSITEIAEFDQVYNRIGQLKERLLKSI
jgi:DNA-binding Xre family transcriptional regulator